jgi:hypothetical protein
MQSYVESVILRRLAVAQWRGKKLRSFTNDPIESDDGGSMCPVFGVKDLFRLWARRNLGHNRRGIMR